MAIRRLPPEVVSRIAAGEVIERPASVLKELLENCLDAGASKVSVEVLGAGKTLLRVVDDGSGIAPDDFRPALERHATSKIRSAEDLDRISTFGFRGEALFSVAAVSRLTVTSALKGSKRGWTIEAEGGTVRAEHEAAPVPGTTVEVKDLFFNTPARLKFLKSDASEKAQLLRVVEEAALAHPGTAFVYKSENRAVLRFPQRASQADRLAEVLGEELSAGLLAVSEDGRAAKLRAFIGPAGNLSSSRNFQYFFVNRRVVSSRVLQQALYRAYEPFRSKDRHPVAAAFLDLPPDQLDVNVHPAKREVRFRSERELYELIVGAFSSALLRSKGIPTITATAGRSFSYPAVPSPITGDGSKWKLSDAPAPELDFGAPAAGSPRWFTPPFRFLGQIERSYLVFDAAGGLLVVDQHAAQERVLFERYEDELSSNRVKTQRLMLPVAVELPASQVQQILAREESLQSAGFGVKAFGRTTIHFTEAPAVLEKAGDLKEVCHRLLESLRSERSASQDVKRHAVATIACKAAVKAHDRLGPEEAVRLVEDLAKCRDGSCCPHGRPAIISLDREELARRFKRPGAPPL